VIVTAYFTDWRMKDEVVSMQAGRPGRIPHDFRRTAERNLERARVPRSQAMKLTGHLTESVYRRYAIVSTSDLNDAADRLAVFTSMFTSAAKRKNVTPTGIQGSLSRSVADSSC
jgi:hypothetical protein